MALQFGLDKICIGKLAQASGTMAIAIGNSSTASNTNSMAIGVSETAASQNGICIGYGCYCGTGTPTLPNICIGYNCGNSAASMASGNNIGIGFGCYSASTADFSNNVAIGNGAMGSGLISGASYNVAIGSAALPVITTGYQNNVIGNFAGNAITTGNQNFLMSYQAGYHLIDASGHVCIGWGSGNTVTSGDLSIYIGGGADSNSATSNGQISIGAGAISGIVSVIIGASSTGYDYSTLIGALSSCVGGGRNVAIGSTCDASAENAICIGGGPGNPIASGAGAIAIGGAITAGTAVTTAAGVNSIAIGLCSNIGSGGLQAIAIGGAALNSAAATVVKGSNSICIGYNSSVDTAHVSTWGDNVSIGTSNNVLNYEGIAIGHDLTPANTDSAYGSATNTFYHIFNVSGSNAVTVDQGVEVVADNPLEFDFVRNGLVKIGLYSAKSAGHYTIGAGDCMFQSGGTTLTNFIGINDANGWIAYIRVISGGCGIRTAWAGTSDMRLKTDIQPARDMLDTCRSLTIYKFALKITPFIYHYGWIAQEILPYLTEEERTKFQLIGEDIDYKTPEQTKYYTIFPQRILAMNFKATQELAALYNNLQVYTTALETENKDILCELEQLQIENALLQSDLNSILESYL